VASRFLRPAAVLGALGLALAVVSSAFSAAAPKMRGVVVHDNRRAHSFVVALAGGRLVAVHSRQSPQVGRIVTFAATPLRNGTYAGRATALGVRAHSARIRGVVTFVDRHHRFFTVSANGASLLVRRSVRASAADAGGTGGLPPVGEDVTVSVAMDSQGDLEDQGVQTTGTQAVGIDLEGTILAVDQNARTLTISADDEDQSGQGVKVVVPPTIDITTFSQGQEVELTVTQQPDGSFLLSGASGDQNQQQANNQNDQQGCQQGDSEDSGQQNDGEDSRPQGSTGPTGTTGTTGATGVLCATGSPDGGNDNTDNRGGDDD
jgi:hypothetical protein